MPSAATAVATYGFERKTRTTSLQNNIRQETPKMSGRVAASAENGVPLSSFPARLPTFHASALGPWHAVITYDACVRLCLHAWAKGCMEAPMFLENECALLRNTFGLQVLVVQFER
ncbi:hypothetical protein POM88_054954 [Heracleum sosnowskyi]|uniref:Uncharacterized protein n=1 Tax=Heracleum sosnowskyi TaxID=360622 RepID=A0AAD8GLD7_9APIA|nr:hypothetical protein POM88_054954 [Heracleum sosnowskyi]